MRRWWPGSARPPEPVLREQVARALVNKGVRLGQLGHSEDAEMAVYEEVVARFGEAAAGAGPARAGSRGAGEQQGRSGWASSAAGRGRCDGGL